MSSGDRTVESSRVVVVLYGSDWNGLWDALVLGIKTRVSVLTSIRHVSIISYFQLGLFGRFRSPLGLVISIEVG